MTGKESSNKRNMQKFVRYAEGAKMYSMGLSKFQELAKDAKACYKVVIGFCAESVDVKDEMRFESILRMFIRLGLAEWFVANNVTIMKAFFTSIGNLVNLMSAGTTVTLSIDST